MSPTHVVHLTSVHSATDIRIFWKEATSLVRRGFRVSVIGPHNCNEMRNGVALIGIRRIRRRIIRMPVASGIVFVRALIARGDVYHLHDPELLVVGLLLRLVGRRVVYDVHEDVPKDVLDKEWIPPLARRPIAALVAAMEAVAGHLYSGIVAATPAIGRRFPAGKTVVVENFPHLAELAPTDVARTPSCPPVFAYVGGILPRRGLEQCIAAVGLLPAGDCARLVMAGDLLHSPLAGSLKQLPGWPRVDAVGMLDRSAVRDLLQRAIAGLVVFQPIANHVEARPNKLFEYMSAGLPVIVSDFPGWREVVEMTEAGLLVDPTSPVAIAEAMRWCLDHPEEALAMGRRGRAAVVA
ncbi:MAG: glycosyltransferase, partial [Terracidiphilus sp.]